MPKSTRELIAELDRLEKLDNAREFQSSLHDHWQILRRAALAGKKLFEDVQNAGSKDRDFEININDALHDYRSVVEGKE